jgi:hypothetical protein
MVKQAGTLMEAPGKMATAVGKSSRCHLGIKINIVSSVVLSAENLTAPPGMPELSSDKLVEFMPKHQRQTAFGTTQSRPRKKCKRMPPTTNRNFELEEEDGGDLRDYDIKNIHYDYLGAQELLPLKGNHEPLYTTSLPQSTNRNGASKSYATPWANCGPQDDKAVITGHGNLSQHDELVVPAPVNTDTLIIGDCVDAGPGVENLTLPAHVEVEAFPVA